MLIQTTRNYNSNPKSTFKNNSLMSKIREVSDEAALKILHEQLSEKMPTKQATSWVQKVKQICEKFDISPSKLPLSKGRPGSLNEDEKYNFFTEVFHNIFNETKLGRFELVAPKAK